jgi:hypothetical protein
LVQKPAGVGRKIDQEKAFRKKKSGTVNEMTHLSQNKNNLASFPEGPAEQTLTMKEMSTIR